MWLYFLCPSRIYIKIDPTTGFINIFNTKECTNAQTIKAFLENFDSIRYSAAKAAFAFDFDYRKFNPRQTDYRNKWTVFSLKEAWNQEKDKNSGKFSAVFHNPTEEIKSAVENTGATIADGFDLLALLRTTPANDASASFFKNIFYAFKLSVALRHSSKEEDRIISPVINSNGEFFTSQIKKNNPLPQDADANGAYHIALKGLYLLKHGIKDGKLGKITQEEWLKFAQTRNQ